MYGEILDNALDQGRTERVDVSIIERPAAGGGKEAVLAVTNQGEIDYRRLRSKAERQLRDLTRTEEGIIINTRRIAYEGELQPLSSDDLSLLPDSELIFISGLSTKPSNQVKTFLLFWAPLLISLGGWYFGTLLGFLSWGVSWAMHFLDLLPVGGMGMGMSAVRQAAANAGGRLEVESSQGITTVSLIFPMAEEKKQNAPRHEMRTVFPGAPVQEEGTVSESTPENSRVLPVSVQGFPSPYHLRQALQQAADAPHTYYFRYEDILNEDEMTVSEAFLALAYQTRGRAARLVVTDAELSNEHLSPLRDLGVQITANGLTTAFNERNQQMAEKYHIVVSRDRSFLIRHRDFMKAHKIKGYLETAAGHFYGALLFGLLEGSRAGMFEMDADGFFYASSVMESQFAAYQQSLIIRMSA